MMRLCRLMTAVTICLGILTPGLASAGEETECSVLRVHPAGLLLNCGRVIKSIVLEFDGMRRQMRNDMNGVLHFVCPIEQMCATEPRVSGWMIDHARWWNTTHDEASIFELLGRPPVILGGMARPLESAGERPTSACGVLELEIAGLPAKAVCYDFPERKSATVVAVASDAEIGFLLLFNQQDIDAAGLREKFQDIALRFKIERASGDANL